MTTRCDRCDKDLSTVKEIHAAEGLMFCSAECAISSYIDEIITNAKETATETYHSVVEIITPEEIGLID